MGRKHSTQMLAGSKRRHAIRTFMKDRRETHGRALKFRVIANDFFFFFCLLLLRSCYNIVCAMKSAEIKATLLKPLQNSHSSGDI